MKESMSFLSGSEKLGVIHWETNAGIAASVKQICRFDIKKER